MSNSNFKYRPDIDGLRALAVFAVVCYHAFPGWVHGGFIGVDIFFVISGYLITTLILYRSEYNTFSILDFYRRRIRRIFPALLIVISTLLIVGWYLLLPDEYDQVGKHTIAGTAFVSNFFFYAESGYFDNAVEAKPLLHLWSLAVEEQFYILWPLLIALTIKCKRNILILVFTCIFFLSFFSNIFLVSRDPSASFFWPITRFWELVAGSSLALAGLNNFKVGSLQKYSNSKALVGLIALIMGFALINDERAFPGWWALLPVIGSCLLISAGKEAWINKYLLSNSVIVWFGLISYPLYLWHWPILSMAFILEGGPPSRDIRIVLVGLSIFLAYITYKFLEKPIREKGLITTKFLLLAMCLLLVSGFLISNWNGFPKREVLGVKRAKPENYKITERHDSKIENSSCNKIKLGPTLSSICVASKNHNSPIQVIVWGDSHAAGIVPAVLRAATEDNYGITVLSNAGCPPIVGVRQSPGATNKSSCEKINQNNNIFEEIMRTKPDILVLAARWDLYFHGFTRNGKIEKTNHFLTTDQYSQATKVSTFEALNKQLPVTIAEIDKRGVVPLLFLNPPVLGGHINNFRMPVEVSLKHHIFYQDFIRKVIHKNSINYFDPASKMCASELCEIYDSHGQALYTDDNHLSIEGAEYLYPEIRSFLTSAINSRSHH